MKNYLSSSTDIRQSTPWAKYMESIGWDVIKVDGVFVYIRRIKYLNRSLIKVQHSKGKINFRKLEKEIKKYNPFFIVFESHIQGFKESDFLKNGYRKSKSHFAPSATIKIDLTKGSSEIFKSFSENARRNIKKAEKNNIKIKIIDLKKDKELKIFDVYFDLVKKLTRKKHFYAPGYNESLKKMNAFKKNSILIFAYEDEDPIAVVWFGYFDKVITYLQTGITDRGYELLANYLLVWQGIKWAKKKGIKVFDFESIYDSRYPNQNKRWLGYTQFKKRFHGEIISYPPSYAKYYNLFFRFLDLLSR